MTDPRPSVTILYHYFHPDDVVSARHFDGLAVGLQERGWRVTARPGNRGCRDEAQAYPARERWRGVRIRRVWRPAFKQASNRGRVLNAAWMIARWSLLALRDKPDVLVVGTDPILSFAVARVWRAFRPRTKIAHWCFDLYPEAAAADGLLKPGGWLVRTIQAVMAPAYRACSLIADLGPCMRRLLGRYRSRATVATLTPWALVEPTAPAVPDPAVRRDLFGDAKLCLLYSGSFGRAHGSAEFVALARKLADAPVRFCFAVRGNRADELKREADGLPNLSFAGFAPESQLEKRLGAADIHLASLRPEWTGVVVPSKFFGSLATGRPVLFAGDPASAIGQWIAEHGVGWVLTPATLDAVADELRRLADDPAALGALQARCHAVYAAHFSRERVLDGWHRELHGLLAQRGGR